MLEIKVVIVNALSKNVCQLKTEVIYFRTIKQFELNNFEKQQVFRKHVIMFSGPNSSFNILEYSEN